VTSIGGGGSVWSPELLRACRKALPHAERAVGVGYGLTECSGLATHAGDEILKEHPDSVGYAIPTCEVAIHDDDDNPLADGEVGNVMLRGPMITPGYWNDPEATAASIRPGGWLRTGDFGRLQNGLLSLASRRTDLIIRGGENIYPVEIENRLDEHPAVREATVVAVDHRELGQEVKAVVVLHDEAAVSTDDLAAFVAETLAPHKVPAHWEIRDEPLPRNASGKVLKRVVTGDAENTFVEE
jgi:long-chain acyl-CoA synthetase